MQITNLAQLPEPLVAAVTNDPYDAGASDISVTSLIGPPQLHALRRRHDAELCEDASDRIWSLLGQAVHSILERADSTALTEQRLYMDVAGWTLSGQFDRLVMDAHGTLQDYKVTSVWTTVGGLKPEWVAQLNCLATLCRANGHTVTRLQIVVIYRDWSRTKAQHQADYPPTQVQVLDVPVWDPAEADHYIVERVVLHQKNHNGALTPCTDDERWYRGEKWAVMKTGRKSALRLLDTETDALEWCIEQNLADSDPHRDDKPWNSVILQTGISLVRRPGQYIRCESYCPVAQHCPQWQQTQKEVVL